jgi:opacity protein-like surface antigen
MSAVLFYLPSVGLAESEPANHTLTLNGGVSFPLSKIDFSDQGGGSAKIGSTGFSVGVQYLYNIFPRLGFGVEINEYGYGAMESQSLIPLTDTTINYKSLVWLGIVKYSFRTEGKMLPYGLFGVGVHNSSMKITTKPQPGYAWADTGTPESRTLVDDSSANLAVAVGIGFDIPINDRFFTGFETRYQYCASTTYGVPMNMARLTGLSEIHGAVAMVNLTGKVGMKF